MSATVICPECRKGTTFAAPPVEACGQCGVRFDAAVAQTAEKALRLERPAFIAVATAWLPLIAIVMPLSLLALIPGCPGSYKINDQSVTHEAFVATGAPVLIAGTVWALLLAYGFVKQRPWSRHVPVVGFLFVLAAAALFPESRRAMFTSTSSWLGYFPLAVWYFYFKGNVTEYYRELGR